MNITGNKLSIVANALSEAIESKTNAASNPNLATKIKDSSIIVREKYRDLLEEVKVEVRKEAADIKRKKKK